jgi:Asp-tRNA(Asn)/Glu-tRNA(Gln) amidotransferase A subunit family amidase
VSETDSLVIEGLRRQGGIVICTGSMMQAALGFDSINNIVGRVKHPFVPERSPGGSSGGDAALVASHCVPFGIGSDIEGSIRVPANFCGLYSHKSTEMRLPDSRNTRRAYPGIQLTFGPIARSAADMTLVIQSLF